MNEHKIPEESFSDEALQTNTEAGISAEEMNPENLKIEDIELEQVSGGRREQKITTDCYYCCGKHVLTYCTDLIIIPHGLKKKYPGATRYFCTFEQKYFYTLELENGGIAILDSDLKVVK